METQLLKTPIKGRGIEPVDVVTLDRTDDEVTLRFMSRAAVGRRGSREIKLGSDLAEQLLNMLSLELEPEAGSWA